MNAIVFRHGQYDSTYFWVLTYVISHKISIVSAQIMMYHIALDIRNLPTVRQFAEKDNLFLLESSANIKGLKGIYTFLTF